MPQSGPRPCELGPQASLIGVVEVKLLLLFLSGYVAPVGHSLLFAVGAGPPHDGVRRARRLNLFRDLAGIAARRFWTLNEIASPIVPTGTIRLALSGEFVETGLLVVQAAARRGGRAPCPSGTRCRRPTCGAG